MSAQSRRSSLIEALSNTAIGFCISLLATLTILPALGVIASAGQSIVMTVMFTGISIVRGYALRRLFNIPSRVKLNHPTYYHVDSAGVSVYKAGALVARIDMSKDQLVGLSIATRKASRQSTPTAISEYLHHQSGERIKADHPFSKNPG